MNVESSNTRHTHVSFLTCSDSALRIRIPAPLIPDLPAANQSFPIALYPLQPCSDCTEIRPRLPLPRICSEFARAGYFWPSLFCFDQPPLLHPRVNPSRPELTGCVTSISFLYCDELWVACRLSLRRRGIGLTPTIPRCWPMDSSWHT